MIFNFLLLKTLVSSSKRFENSPASVKNKIRVYNTGENELPRFSRSIPRLLLPTDSMFPGKCNSQEQLSDRRS